MLLCGIVDELLVDKRLSSCRAFSARQSTRGSTTLPPSYVASYTSSLTSGHLSSRSLVRPSSPAATCQVSTTTCMVQRCYAGTETERRADLSRC